MNMYTNRYWSDSLDYVKENLEKKEILEFVEFPKNNLPEPIYEDDPNRTWEIWKKTRGYKLYNIESSKNYKISTLNHDTPNVMEDHIRLYRTAPKTLMQSKPKSSIKTTVPSKINPEASSSKKEPEPSVI